MRERFDLISYLIRSRVVFLGSGSVEEIVDGPRRKLVCEIPGTRLRAVVVLVGRHRIAGAFFQNGRSIRGHDLADEYGLAVFMHAFDQAIMQHGIGSAYFPSCVLEFIDRLVFGTDLPDVMVLGARKVGSYRMQELPEWRAEAGFRELVETWCSAQAAPSAVVQAADAVMSLMDHGVEAAFDARSSKTRWVGQVLGDMIRHGRRIPSADAEWCELLSLGCVKAAAWLMSRNVSRPTTAAMAIFEHIATFTRAKGHGGCDIFVRWKDGEPLAIAALAVDGNHVVVTGPDASVASGTLADELTSLMRSNGINVE